MSRSRPARQPERWIILLLILVILGYTIYFSAYQIRRHRTFRTSLDLVTVEQPLWNTLHGRFMRATYYPVTGVRVTEFDDRPSESLFEDHIQPTLLVLFPFYALVPRSETLMILLCGAVALGAVPMFRIAYRRLESSIMAFFFVLMYLFLPAVEANTGNDIHAVAFVPPLLLAALDAIEEGHRDWWWWWSLLAMGCREDLPLLVGWAMIWIVPRYTRREAWKMFGVGAVLTFLYMLVVLPWLSGGGGIPYLARFVPLGTDLTLEGLLPLIKDPAFWIKDLGYLLGYNLRLGLPLLFLYWLDSSALLAMAPVILLNGLSWYEHAHYPHLYHYSAPIIPWVLTGTIIGFKALEEQLERWRSSFRWRGVLVEALGVAVIASHVIIGYTPLTVGFVWPQDTGRDASVRALLNQIPVEDSVSAEAHLAAHLGRRETLRFFPDIRDAEWIIMDFWFGEYFYLSYLETWHEVVGDPQWRIVEAHDGLALLKQDTGPSLNLSQAFRPSQRADIDLGVRFDTGKGILSLNDITLFQDAFDRVTVCTDWIGTGADSPVPWMAVGNGEIKPLESTKFAPNLMSVEGKIRDCTRFLAGTGESYIHLHVEDEVGQRSVIFLTRPLPVFERITVVDNVIHFVLSAQR